MPYQSTVEFNQGAGVPGELYDSGPVRSQPWTLVSALASYNVFGRAFTVTSQGVAKAGNPGGGDGFAGILANPKAHASYGTTSGTLAPTLTLPNNALADLVTMGTMWVNLSNFDGQLGDPIVFDNTTGILSSIPVGDALPSGKTFAQAVIDRFTVGPTGLAVIQLTNVAAAPATA